MNNNATAMSKTKEFMLNNNLNSNYVNASLNDLHRLSSTPGHGHHMVNQSPMHHIPNYAKYNGNSAVKNRNFNINLVDRSHTTPTTPVDKLANGGLSYRKYDNKSNKSLNVTEELDTETVPFI